ncbi:YceI-like domain-containing protein [Fodinibius salinus]|uniref:YceI-like domain-containing protein n=1 Tax=Fodinibius salinus TaxID=860790 RepID=A0A5D3YNE3_9BACT|nr:YceI family protein [Fodinibius salinus]TYP93669.1 YceI-like domain-containing protein [Fodinibius salinus]
MKSIITILLLMFTLGGTVQAQNQNLTLMDKSTMQIDGTSNVHDWTADVTEFSTSITMNSDTMDAGAPARLVKSFTLTVPVDKIKSGKGRMDKKIRGALKEEEHPTINFSLSSVDSTLSSDSTATADSTRTVTTNATGELTVSGVTRNITLPVESMLTEEGSVKFMGNYELNMKDYDVEPPSVMFGAISSGEKVTITFELFFAKK